MKLPQYDIWAETVEFWGEKTEQLNIDDRPEGDWIRKDDLVHWLLIDAMDNGEKGLYIRLSKELKGE